MFVIAFLSQLNSIYSYLYFACLYLLFYMLDIVLHAWTHL